MVELLFNIIGFACFGIVVSMQMAHANQWLHDNLPFGYIIPYPLKCNKCLTFWTCLAYQLTNVNPIEALLTAATAATLSIIIYHRL
jgi:hypothetical protein